METAVDPYFEILLARKPDFCLSPACISSNAGTIAVANGSMTFYEAGNFFPDHALHDCILVSASGSEQLSNPRQLADILHHLTANGLLITVFPASGTQLHPNLEKLFESAGLFMLNPEPLDARWSILTFAKSSFDPLPYARQLAESGMPARGAALLEWLTWHVPLTELQRAGVAVEKLRLYQKTSNEVDPASNHSLLFLAQKEFHIAVHTWPRRHELYREHASIWRRFGNDDYAARLLRSIEYVEPDPETRRLLAECHPENAAHPREESCPEWHDDENPPRILVLTHPASDYGMDSLYDGLCQVLGWENVVEYPWKSTLHGRDRDATLKYPCWFDYPGEPRTVENLETELRDGRFDIIVFADFVNRANQPDVLRLLNAAPDVPVVAYDPWDDGSATRNEAEKFLGGRSISVYFKREMLACLDYGPNAFPLPFAYPDRHVSDVLSTKDTDLFWAGKRLFGTRALYLDRLNQLLQRTLDQSLTQEEYKQAIARARIGLSFFGFGFDTVRYWELAAHGCMILAERPLIRIPYNFTENRSAVFFDDLQELEEKLSYYLAHPSESMKIAQEGHAHFRKYHTTSARARQFLGRIHANLPARR